MSLFCLAAACRAIGNGEIDVDLFAGGGGASEGMRRAIIRALLGLPSRWVTEYAEAAA